MSTLQSINLKHPSSASNNIVLDSSGNATVANNLSFNSGYGSSAVAYGCRAWVNFNGTGTIAIRASGNVSSLTDGGTGDYVLNFSTAMPDVNYSVAGTCNNTGTQLQGNVLSARSLATASCGVTTTDNNSDTMQDCNLVLAAVFR